MKQIFNSFFLLVFTHAAIAQNIGIGTATPSQKFTVRQDGVGITQENSNGVVQVGFYTDLNIAYLQTHTNHPLAFSTNNGSAQMLLSTTGNFGIGTGNSSSNTSLAGLVVNKKVGGTNALFGDNTTGVAIESASPGIGFNTYYNTSRKNIKDGHGSWLGLDPVSGSFMFQSSATAGTEETNINLNTRLVIDKNGLIGIGNVAPNATAQLHVDVGTSTTKGLLVTGSVNTSSTVPDLGAGTRLMFYPGKSAFRAGAVNGGQWNNTNVGLYSFATGFATIARGSVSTAMGNETTASGAYSTAMGFSTTANGVASTAIGVGTTANGVYSTAMGNNSTAGGYASVAMGNSSAASGDYSTAMGISTTASGANSTAMGYNTIASGNGSTATGRETSATGNFSTAMGYGTEANGANSTAMGTLTTASGIYSTAMGHGTTSSGSYSTAMGSDMNTNNQTGAFAIGDSDPNNEGIVNVGLSNQFVARFWNGYYFLTSGNTSRYGVSIGHNGNAWVSICDSNRKENVEPLNGEEVLQKFSNINFSSWNYKQQDPALYRHYGVMAQDFYAAFGQDSYGTIGNDTTVNPVDMIGIDMTAIKALEKRTTELRLQNQQLKTQNEKLAMQNGKLEMLLQQMEQRLKKLEKVNR